MVFAVVLFPVAIIGARHGSAGLLAVQLVTLTISFVTSVLISPIGSIAICLIYFDERVRREGFDIEFLMNRSAPIEEPTVEPGTTQVVDVDGETLLGREPAQ
jgi:hypothetical protein